MTKGPQGVFWIVVIALLLLTRIPAGAKYMSIDNVNLALALEDFDPLNHQPQPPGYPFFVAFARIVNFFFRDAERTFLAISVLVSGLCLPLTAVLGRRLFSERAGYAAVLFLLVNPVFWHTGLDGPLRPFLALFSLWTAYCGWRAWNGEERFVLWGAVALGIGAGFRPDLLAFLSPIWLVSAWVGTRSQKVLLKGMALLAAIGLVGVAGLTYAVEGARVLYDLTMTYLVDQSRAESVVLGGNEWMRPLSRLVTWNGLAVIGWIWALPFALRRPTRVNLRNPQILFMSVWLIPGLIVQVLIHVAAPGHTLFSIPAWCMLGGCVIWKAAERLESAPGDSLFFAQTALAAGLLLNVLLFSNYFPVATVAKPGLLQSVKNAMVFGTLETSLNQVKWLDDVSKGTLDEMEKFTPSDRPMIVVTNDVHSQLWFMNWRIARYYAPNLDMWVTAGQRSPKQVLHIKRDKTLETRVGEVIQIPVPRGGRVIWLIERETPFHKALAKLPNVQSGVLLFYSDVAADAAPFRILDFEFIPTDFTEVES